jgi:hypothetical protein
MMMMMIRCARHHDMMLTLLGHCARILRPCNSLVQSAQSPLTMLALMLWLDW